MQNLQEYKCPCCGGAIAFDSTAQKLKCPYCDTEFEIETLKGYEEELEGDSADNMEWQTDAGSEWQQGEADGLCNYSCNSCGGEIVADETTAATKCPFCDNPVIMKGRLSGMLKPDYVIPFKLDKKAAKAAYMRHIEGKRLLPKLFRDQNRIDEIKGIYVPFWLFDAEADANVRYHAEIVHPSYEDSENRYTPTSHYMVQRGGSIGFENVPVDGSEKMADDLMESIEPFDFSEAVDFQTAYLAGYLADKYDVSVEDSRERADTRCEGSLLSALERTVSGYTTCNETSRDIHLKRGKVHYALLPVWILNTRWEGKDFLFAMNGQTGKLVGNLPVSTKRVIGLFAAIAASLIAISVTALLLLAR